jgi:hypothetical protein
MRKLITLIFLALFFVSPALAQQCVQCMTGDNPYIQADDGVSICSGTGDIVLATDCTGGGTTKKLVISDGSLVLENDVFLQSKLASGTTHDLIGLSSSDDIEIGQQSGSTIDDILFWAIDDITFTHNGLTKFQLKAEGDILFFDSTPNIFGPSGNAATLSITPASVLSNSNGAYIQMSGVSQGNGGDMSVGAVDDIFFLNNGTTALALDAGSSSAIFTSDITLANSAVVINAGGGLMEVPNRGTLPSTCNTGEILLDVNSDDCANTGSGDGALCLCKTTNTWVLLNDV